MLIPVFSMAQDCTVEKIDSMTIGIEWELDGVGKYIVWAKWGRDMDHLASRMHVMFDPIVEVKDHSSEGRRIGTKWRIEKKMAPGCYFILVRRHTKNSCIPVEFGKVNDIICLNYKPKKIDGV